MKRLWVAALASAATFACASKADVETMGEALRAEIQSIEQGQGLLLAQLEGGLDSLELAALRRETVGRGELARQTDRLADLVEQLTELAADNNQLLNDIYEAVRDAGAGPQFRQGPIGPVGPADPSGARAGGAPAGSGDAEELYGMALDMFNRGNVETARDAFRSFLAENGGHELAPDAQYYLARTYEDAGDIDNALEEYRRVTELHPDSNRAPAALYRRGMIEAGRRNAEAGIRLFRQVEIGYPNSPEAPLARRERERLGG